MLPYFAWGFTVSCKFSVHPALEIRYKILWGTLIHGYVVLVTMLSLASKIGLTYLDSFHEHYR